MSAYRPGKAVASAMPTAAYGRRFHSRFQIALLSPWKGWPEGARRPGR